MNSPYPPTSIITILAMLAILAGATLSISGFSVIGSVVAQTTDGSGSISSTAPPGGNTTGTISSTDPQADPTSDGS